MAQSVRNKNQSLVYFRPERVVYFPRNIHRFLEGTANALERIINGEKDPLDPAKKFEELIQNDQLNVEAVWKFIQTVDKEDPQLGNYLDMFLDYLPSDSLFAPSTSIMLHKTMTAPVVPSSRSLQMLVRIVKERPVYAATMMSPWITLMELLDATSSIAGSEGMDALLDDILSLQDTIYTEHEMASLFTSNYLVKYFAAANQYPKFIHQFEDYLDNHFIDVDLNGLIDRNLKLIFLHSWQIFPVNLEINNSSRNTWPV